MEYLQANSLLSRGEQAALPTPQGAREQETLRGPCTRSALLKARLYDTITAYTKQFSVAEAATPERIRKDLDSSLNRFAEQTAQQLFAAMQQSFWRGNSADQTAAALSAVFQKSAGKSSAEIACYHSKAA